jgi:hypothetical protein
MGSIKHTGQSAQQEECEFFGAEQDMEFRMDKIKRQETPASKTGSGGMLSVLVD